MVDCHPEETLSTEAEPGSTMLSEGRRSIMSSRKECNIYFIMPNVPISSKLQVCVMKKVCASGNILIVCYPFLWRRATFYLNVTRSYDVGQHFTWMLPVPMTSGNTLLECYPFLWRRATFYLNVTRSYDVGQHFNWMLPVPMTSGNTLLECYPFLWRRATLYLNVTRSYDVGQHFTWMLPVPMTSGNILLECYPLLRRCSECHDVRHMFLDLNRTCIFFTQSTFFWMLPSSIYPL